jgi:hypothetical protein
MTENQRNKQQGGTSKDVSVIRKVSWMPGVAYEIASTRVIGLGKGWKGLLLHLPTPPPFHCFMNTSIQEMKLSRNNKVSWLFSLHLCVLPKFGARLRDAKG